MMPVDQSIIHDPANGAIGDCFRACLASILELSIEDVPHFMEVCRDDDSADWATPMQEWLGNRGLMYLDLALGEDPDVRIKHRIGWCIVTGRSARPGMADVLHSVVGWQCEPYHDPNPTRAGILPGGWLVGILVPLDPAATSYRLAAE